MQWQIQWEDPGGPVPLIRPVDACLRLKFLHRQDHTSLFNWLFFLMKRENCIFPPELNSRDVHKINVNCLWVPFYDVNEICTENLCYQAEEEDVPRVHSLQVEFTGRKK